jgi:hypothetical protein
MENKKTVLLPLWAGQDFLNDKNVILPEFKKIVEDKTTRVFKGSKLIVEALDRGKKGWWVDLDSVEIGVFN